MGLGEALTGALPYQDPGEADSTTAGLTNGYPFIHAEPGLRTEGVEVVEGVSPRVGVESQRAARVDSGECREH